MVKDLVVRQSLFTSTLTDVCQNIRNNTNKHIIAHSPTVRAGVLGLLHQNARLACGNFFDVSSRFQMMPKWHMVSLIRLTLRQHYVKRFFVHPISCKATCRHPILSRKSFQWLSAQIPFKRKPQVLELRPKILVNGIEVDEARWWSVPMPAVFSNFGASPCSSEIYLFQSLHLRFKIAFLPCDFDVVHTLGWKQSLLPFQT